MICIYILSFQDIRGGLVFPMKGHSLHWFVDLFTQVRTGDVKGSFDRSIKLAVLVTVITLVVSLMAGLAFRRRFFGDTRRVLPDDRQPGGARAGARPRHRPLVPVDRHQPELVHLRAWRATVLDAAVRRAGDVRRDVPLRQRVGGGGAGSRRHPLANHQAGGDSRAGAGPCCGRAVRLHAVLRRIRPHAADRRARSIPCRSRSGA